MEEKCVCISNVSLLTDASSTEMSVRMSNLDNERDERDDDSHEDRGISRSLIFCFLYIKTLMLSFCKLNPVCLIGIFVYMRLI